MIKNFIDKTKLLFSIYANYFQKFLNLLNKYSKIILFIAFVGFAILTTVGILHSEPWFDEAQAWLIAKNLGPIEILKHMKYEGHMFLWFYVLKPLTMLKIPYPMPMLIANMLFMWGAVFVFLKKAPINPLLKVLIIFSAPIAYQYAIIARCYAIGIFFLFLLAAFYKDKLKHPYWYAVLIFLCANTSVMALFGAAAFGALFFYDYIKDKPEFYKSKEFYIICSIALFCAGILSFQLLGAQNEQRELLISSSVITVHHNYLELFFKTLDNGLSNLHNDWRYFAGYLYLFLSILLFANNKKVLFFWGMTLVSMASLFLFVYNGFKWHHYFYYVYFIISFWLFNLLQPTVKKCFYYPFIILLCLITIKMDYSTFRYIDFDVKHITSYSQTIANNIAHGGYDKKGNLVICNDLAYSVIPYLDNLGVKIYNCTDKKQNSFFDRSSDMNWYLKSETISPKYFKKFENKDIFLLLTNNNLTQLYSDYYMLSLEFCEKPAISDGQLCLIKLTPGY